jgi:UDP-glucose 4-epimerase
LKIVVFGGSGFLGSHVADVLSERGHEVIIFDLVKSLYLNSSQKMIIGDILIEQHVADAMKGADYVYNFAGYADLTSASDKPLETAKLNIIGNINILNSCKNENVKRLIYASTIYVYSQKGGFYRCSKQASELYIEEFSRKFGLDFTILRYGTLFGPRADEKNAIYHYLKEAYFNKKIHCSNPDEIREYIHVRNAAELSIDILKDEYRNRHIIISGHYIFKVRDMMNVIKEILNNEVDIEYTKINEGVRNDHYSFSPYSFSPKIGYKLVSNEYIDMGQGLLECLEEISRKT